jgi:16S rRNA processing protein RimM
MPSRASDDLVAIGRVVKPQGRKGEVVVAPLSDLPGRFPGLRRVLLRAAEGVREVAVTHVWPHKGRYVLKLEGVDSISAAEELRALEVFIREDELPALPEGSYYHHQLRGLRVEDEDGALLGTVTSVLETGGEAPVLEVQGPAGERLLPLAESFVKQVDLARGRLVVAWPESVEA